MVVDENGRWGIIHWRKVTYRRQYCYIM